MVCHTIGLFVPLRANMVSMGIETYIAGIYKAIEDDVLVRVEMRNGDGFDFAEVAIVTDDAGNGIVHVQTYERLPDGSLKPSGDWRELDGSDVRHVILHVDKPVPRAL